MLSLSLIKFLQCRAHRHVGLPLGMRLVLCRRPCATQEFRYARSTDVGISESATFRTRRGDATSTFIHEYILFGGQCPLSPFLLSVNFFFQEFVAQFGAAPRSRRDKMNREGLSEQKCFGQKRDVVLRRTVTCFRLKFYHLRLKWLIKYSNDFNFYVIRF